MPANFINPDFFTKRSTESQIGFEKRVGPYLAYREDAQADADQAHAEFRQQQEARSQGTGVGLMGDASPQDRAAALGSRGFGGAHHVESAGHLGWEASHSQPGVQRVYASQLDSGPDQLGVSPLVAFLRGQM